MLVRGVMALRSCRRLPLRLMRPLSSAPSSAQTHQRGQKMRVNGVDLHYVHAGEGGHPILCIAGALGTATNDFSPQLDYFGGSDQFSIVGYDPRGYGSSQPPRRNFSITPHHFLKQDGLDGHELMQQLGFKEFSVLGWSDGGVAALFLAAAFPQSVRKLAVWGAGAFISSDDVKLFEQTRNIDDWSTRKRAELEPIYGSGLGTLWSDWVDSQVELVQQGGDMCKGELKNITCPTLILHGDKDPLTPGFHVPYLDKHIRGPTTVHRFPNGRHGIHLQYANEFNEFVKKFLLS